MAATPESHPCAHCGADLPAKPKGQRGRPRKYCDGCRPSSRPRTPPAQCKKCAAPLPDPATYRSSGRGGFRTVCDDCTRTGRNAYYRDRRERLQSDRRSDSDPASTLRKTCRRCGEPLVGRQRFWCSKTCTEIAAGKRRAAPLGDRTCVVCDARFAPRSANQLYCTGFQGKCYRRAMNARYRGVPLIKGAVGTPFDCAECGAYCVPGENVAPHATKFCSRAHKRAAIVAARAELVADLGEFDWKIIGPLDDWTCGICGDAVDPAVPFPEPLAPTVDHVVPLSRTGEHSLENVQLAHFVCNARKGNRLPDEAIV